MTAKKPLAIAIDLGGTQIRAALFAAERMLSRAALPTDVSGGPVAILDQMHALITQVCEGTNIGDVVGVGLSTAGPVNTETGVFLDIPTLPGFESYPVRSELTERIGLPVHIENDAIAAALGEWRHGAGRGVQNLVYITVSTGIGGGVVMDGRLIHGRMGMAGHVGHMNLALQGPLCSCGATGCFEAFASGTALAKRADLACRTEKMGHLAKVRKTGGVTAIDVFDGARAGDRQCISLVDEEAMYLGQGITSLIHIFSPERIIMGGGMSHAFDMLQHGIQAVIQAQAMEPFRDVPVVCSALGENSGLVGAATMVLEPTSSR